MPINPNDLPHDPDTGKPIYPKAEAEKLPVGTKHLDDGSKRLPDGGVIASPAAVEGPPNPNDLPRDPLTGKLTPESQEIIAKWHAKNSPAPKYPDAKAKPADVPVEPPAPPATPEGAPAPPAAEPTA